MALISCKECSKQISDMAVACPQCGAPQSHGTSEMAANNFPTLNQVQQAANLGQLDEALCMMDKVLKAHPNNAKSHFVRAKLFAMQGRFKSSGDELRTAERLKPDLSFATPHAVQELKNQLAAATKLPGQEANLIIKTKSPKSQNPPSEQQKRVQQVTTVAVLIGAFLIFRSCTAPLTPEEQAKAAAAKSEELAQKAVKRCEDNTMAKIQAEDFVLKNLKAPSTADFSSRSNNQFTYLGECKYDVQGYVDAQNSFGAKIRSNYHVILQYQKDFDRYVLLNIEIKGE